MYVNETALTASVPKKPIALSAVNVSNDQRALERVSVGYNNDSTTYRIHDRTKNSNGMRSKYR